MDQFFGKKIPENLEEIEMLPGDVVKAFPHLAEMGWNAVAIGQMRRLMVIHGGRNDRGRPTVNLKSLFDVVRMANRNIAKMLVEIPEEILEMLNGGGDDDDEGN